MMRHALLIGSQVGDLRGPHNDLEAMQRLLSNRSFALTVLREATATRECILDEYRALIKRAKMDDAVVIYYSGHGGIAEDENGRRLQYILPTDWVDDERTFRGIIDAELSGLLAELTAVTTNVAVILDCCHSSLISRGVDPPPGLVQRAVKPSKWTPAIAAHVAQYAPKRVYAAGNPHAVRLVACEADREAFESDQVIGGQRVRRGFLTLALERVLEDRSADALSWRGVADRVREQVLTLARNQLASVEGPADRVLFTTSEVARPDAVVYFERDRKPALRVSRILGARVNSVYDIVRLGATTLADDTIVATATITTLEGAVAEVALSNIKANSNPEVGALAFPRTSPFPPARLALAGENAALHERLAGSTLIEIVPETQARFVIATQGETLTLTDHIEFPPAVFELTNDAAGRELVAKRVERWAKAEALRDLRGDGLRDAIGLSWGVVVNRKLVERTPGEPLRVGESLCVRAKNMTKGPLYMWIFDVGISGKVTLLTITREGRQIEPGKTLSIGEDDGVTTGAEISWPDDLGTDVGPRRESVVVLAASDWMDAGVFETPHLRARGVGGPSRLETLLRSLGAGATRDLRPKAGTQTYAVARIDFDLHPPTKLQ